MCNAAKFVNSVEESKALNEGSWPRVIIAASGMATGGRVLHHLRAFAPDPRNTDPVHRLPGGGHARPRRWSTARPRSRCSASTCRCAPRSRCSIRCRRMPTTRSCSTGCAAFPRRRGDLRHPRRAGRRRCDAPAGSRSHCAGAARCPSISSASSWRFRAGRRPAGGRAAGECGVERALDELDQREIGARQSDEDDEELGRWRLQSEIASETRERQRDGERDHGERARGQRRVRSARERIPARADDEDHEHLGRQRLDEPPGLEQRLVGVQHGKQHPERQEIEQRADRPDDPHEAAQQPQVPLLRDARARRASTRSKGIATSDRS